tara:strand:+ start:7098 stop:7646 length:549 start_codon:yes stop_codon:yes gene_type:complete
MVLGTLATRANEITIDFVTRSTEKSIVFNLAQASKLTSIQFLDNERNIIYSGDIQQYTSLRKKFDLSKLEPGSYTLNVEDTLKIITYVIAIDESEISVVSKNEIIKPAFRLKENVVFINLMNLSKEEVTVIIFDQENRVLHTEKISDQLVVEKAINFKKAFKGSYSIVVKTPKGKYQKYITI